MTLNPPLIAVSALFFVGLTSAFYLATYAVISLILRVIKHRASHAVKKRTLMAAIVLPPLVSLVLTL